MNDETRKQVALCRYKLISPVLVEPGRVQNEYFREQSHREHVFPHYGPQRVAVSTFKRWLRLYRERGFEALFPRVRSDSGRPRRLGESQMAAVRAKCKAFPAFTVRMLYEELARDHQLGMPPVSYNTLLRTVNKENLLPASTRKDTRKRYEMDETNELWVCDFMHGPVVQVGSVGEKARTAKSILCAVIDDHTRMVVGHAFSTHENVSSLTVVLKEAFLAFGLPRRLYVDNGPAFSSDLLLHSCALCGISLIHSKPYDSPSRGKIERFFRTVRDRFLPGLCSEPPLHELNEAFALWLKEDYHHKTHSGIGEKPIERHHASSKRVEIRRLSHAELDTAFLVRHERVVGNDATISFKGRVYEVPPAYIRQRIEIRHPIDDRDDLALYDNGARVAKLKLVDVHENARTFRPNPGETRVSFAKGRATR